MVHRLRRAALAVLAAAALLAPSPSNAADGAAGGKIVQTNGCTGCHGASFEGGVGPKLAGIEHRRTPAEITAAIVNPKAPMPRYPLTGAQVADVVAYLSALDGGAAMSHPVATLTPAKPGDRAVLSVRFPGTPPKRVTALASMRMGGSSMHGGLVTLRATKSDPHVFEGPLEFSMGGAWTVDITYDGKHMTLPVNASGGM
jgi:mono/diheme cytochrome c family protein